MLIMLITYVDNFLYIRKLTNKIRKLIIFFKISVDQIKIGWYIITCPRDTGETNKKDLKKVLTKFGKLGKINKSKKWTLKIKQ